jgi:DNA-binding response OmpR family regulator
MPSDQVVLVGDDANARAFLTQNLTADGYTVQSAPGQAEARSLLTGHDLVLCDLPAGETLALLDELKAHGTPVVALTAGADEVARVRLLERGADDVIVKPYGYIELRARVAAVLRRCTPGRGRAATVAGPVEIDRLKRRVRIHGREVHLSDVEFRLLEQLASDPTRVFTRAELMRDVWGYECPTRSRTLDSHAYRLRRRLDAGVVHNVWGVGYRLIAG